MDLLDADRGRIIERIIDGQVVGRLNPNRLALVADHDRAAIVIGSAAALLFDAGLGYLAAELERRAVERRYLVVSLDQQVGDAKTVERRQQMLDGADRVALAVRVVL